MQQSLELLAVDVRFSGIIISDLLPKENIYLLPNFQKFLLVNLLLCANI